MGCAVFLVFAALIVGVANMWAGLLLLLLAFIIALADS